MRIGVLPLVLLFASSASAAAQSAASPRVTSGLEAGLALSTLSSYQTDDVDDAFDTSSRSGFTFGGFASIALSDMLAVRPEVLFVQKGAKIQFAGSTGTDAVVDLRYVEIPVLLRIAPGVGRVRWFIAAGPTFAFKVRARVDASASGGPDDVDVDSQVRSADAGIAVGGGVDVRHWSFEARLVQGYLDIGNTRQVDEAVRTRTLSLFAGLRF